jgi:hypothetical protein
VAVIDKPHDHTPRSAAALLSEALSHLDKIQPPAAREPVRQMFRAAIETCALSRSLLGMPVVYVLELAQALVDEPPDAY